MKTIVTSIVLFVVTASLVVSGLNYMALVSSTQTATRWYAYSIVDKAYFFNADKKIEDDLYGKLYGTCKYCKKDYLKDPASPRQFLDHMFVTFQMDSETIYQTCMYAFVSIIQKYGMGGEVIKLKQTKAIEERK